MDEYCLQRVIGKGSFGEVYLTTKNGTNELYATKRINKHFFNNNKNKKYINNEINIIKQVSHPNIMKFYDLKKTRDNIYIITDFCNGGPLSTALEFYISNNSKPFPEEIVQYLGNQICSAIQYLHNHNILHRDIKLDNILLSFDNDKDKNELNLFKAKIKIIDFGFARYLLKNEMAQSVLGSPLFMEPNLIKKINKIDNNKPFTYDEKVDIWSLGAVFLKLLIGVTPFEAESKEELYNKVYKGIYKIPNSLHLSKQAISFINSMLQHNPTARLEINELVNHDFLTQPVSSFTRLNLVKAEKLFLNKNEIMLNAKQMNNIWFIFGDIEEEVVNIEKDELYKRVKKSDVKRESIIENDADIIGNFLNDYKQVLLPIVEEVIDEKQNEFEKSDKNVLLTIKNSKISYDISQKEKDILDNAFLLMNKDGYSIDPMFIPVIPSNDDEMYEINV